MKAALAILLVVAVAEFVECMPQVKESLQTRLAQLQARGKGNGKSKGKGEDDWPVIVATWIEFSQLIGKCEANRNYLEFFNLTYSDIDEDYCVLGRACPEAMKIAEAYLNATDEEKKEISEYLASVFHLIQCVNLEAVKESVIMSLWVNNATVEDDVYLEESKPLFEMCEEVFDTVEIEADQFVKYLDDAEILEDTKKRNIKAELQHLLRIVARKVRN